MNTQDRIIIVIVLFLCLIISKNVSANYKLDETRLNAAFSESIDITPTIHSICARSTDALGLPSEFDLDNPDYKTAAMLAFGETFLSAGIYGVWFMITLVTGGFGIVLLPGAAVVASLIGSPWHRYYLGTDDNSFKIGALYCVTSNGFGLLLIADAISFLVADENHHTYINNSNFIMWVDEI